MMRNIHLQIMCSAFILLVLAVAGCVAPPQETTTGPVDLYDPNQFTQVTTKEGGSPGLLAEATPFQTTATPTKGFSVYQTPTLNPEDMVCLIDIESYNWAIGSNRTAKKIELKNPPMYINYTLTKPYNITGTKIVTVKGKEEKIKINTYNPYSFLEINIKDSTTGASYIDDGFGKEYGWNLNKTIQVQKTGSWLIEISGLNVTPTIGFWVKPTGNLDTTIVNISTLDCRSQDEVKKLNQ